MEMGNLTLNSHSMSNYPLETFFSCLPEELFGLIDITSPIPFPRLEKQKQTKRYGLPFPSIASVFHTRNDMAYILT